MRIKRKYLSELTSQERSAIRNLTVNSSYGMRGLLKAVKKDPETHWSAEIFLLYSAGKLIGWSSIAPHTFTYSNRTELWVYVRRSHRRKGIGSILYKLAKRRLRRLEFKKNSIAPWNDTGYKFFQAQGVRV